MEKLLKINNKMKQIEEFLMCLFVWGMAAILISNVLARHLFNSSISFAEEMSTLFTIVVTYAGVSFCAHTGNHIIMTAFYDIMPDKIKKVMMIIVSMVTSVAMVYLAYYGFSYCHNLFVSGRVTPALAIPLWIPYLIIPVFLLCTAERYFVILLLNLTDKEKIYTCIEAEEDNSAFSEDDL